MASSIEPKLSLSQLEDLKSWATANQLTKLEAVIRHKGNRTDAAKELGIAAGTMHGALHRFAKTAAARGWSPEGSTLSHDVAPGYKIKGTSTLYGPNGETKLQWVKTNADEVDQIEALKAAIECLNLEPFKRIDGPKNSSGDLLCVLPIGDPHVGMYAWAREAGHDFDLKIAERNILSAVDYLIDLAPPAGTALVLPLGDFFHADNGMGQTTAGTNVDVDSRWPKVLQIGLKIIRHMIDRALEKFGLVHFRAEIGNHDTNTAVFLALAMELLYEDNPRVIIDTDPGLYYYLRFGKCLLGSHHGNRASFKDLPGIMQVDRRKDWGETEFAKWYVGHVHHESVKEHRGIIVETYRTLSPSDAWHRASGYRSGRDMRCEIWHKEHGPIGNHIVGIKRLLERSTTQ